MRRGLIERFRAQKILVVGDVMLDEHICGTAERLSPEAPVPVIEVASRRFTAGGAGNVAANAAALGASVSLLGVAGDDPEAQSLRRLLEGAGVEPFLIVEADRATTTKTRIVAHGQQIVRVDRESRQPIAAASAAQLIAEFQTRSLDCGCAVISDYAKGVLTADVTRELIASARTAGIPVVADPKRDDFRLYAGATLITPNQLEALAAARRDGCRPATVEEAGEILLGMLDGSAVLVTRGEHGMTLFQRDRKPVTIAATAREVYDVTGAGDTVVAALALCIACGETLESAADVANRAAGLVVAKRFTAIVSAEELLATQAQKEPSQADHQQ